MRKLAPSKLRMRDRIGNMVSTNPIKSAAALVASLAVIVGAVVAVDDRYFHKSAADEYKAEIQKANDQFQANLSKQLARQRLYSDQGRLQLRKSALEKSIYDAAYINQESGLKGHQAASFARDKAELDDVNSQLLQLSNLINALR